MSRYALDWSFGLKASSGKFLTVETFQNKIAATSVTMKKKQIFFLEADGPEGTVNLKAHTGKYITVDGDGKLKADGEKGNDENNIIIEAQPDGRWLLKSAKYGWYLGGTGENLTAFITEATADRYWSVELAMHPQITLSNVKRTRYVHLNGDTLTTDSDLPWGHEATLNLVNNNGMVKIQANNGAYLEDSGRMTDDASSPSTDFILDFQGDVVAFKSKKSGKYLSCLGATGLLKATKPSIAKDELFLLEDSWPQVTLKACKSDKYLSIKQGVEVSACADEVTQKEVFQIEPQDDGTWVFKTIADKFLGIKDGGLNCDCGQASVNGSGMGDGKGSTLGITRAVPGDDNKFQVDFQPDNKVSLTASNGKTLKQKMNKYIGANGDNGSEDDTQFVMEIINRPVIALRGSFGFIGKLESGILNCNRSTAEYFAMQATGQGYELEGWTAADNAVNVASGGESYSVELLKESKLAIKYDGKYLEGFQNGEVKFSGSSIGVNSSWEY